MNHPVMGIQLYTLRDYIQTAQDFDATLARLERLGVTDVQISAIGNIPAETQKEILEKHGIKVCVTHKPFERMTDDLPALIEEHKIIGCDAIGLGAAPHQARESRAGALEFIRRATVIGETLKKHGMTFHYHNHDFEFLPLPEGGTLMDLLLEETDPETFRFIPDVMWAHFAGQDPAALLRKMKGRVKVLHFKDYILNEAGERKFTSLGSGITNLTDCYEAAKELGIPYIMYEQDADWTGGDPFVSTEESWAYMKKLEAQA